MSTAWLTSAVGMSLQKKPACCRKKRRKVCENLWRVRPVLLDSDWTRCSGGDVCLCHVCPALSQSRTKRGADYIWLPRHQGGEGRRQSYFPNDRKLPHAVPGADVI